MDWRETCKDKLVTAEEAAKLVRSGDRVVVTLQSQPMTVLSALAARKDELRGVTVLSHWSEDHPWFQPGYEESFLVETGFVTGFTRQGHRERRFDYVPAAFGLHEGIRHTAPLRGAIYANADFYMLSVTPPNNNGWCSYGHHVWYSGVATKTAKTVIAEVDSSLPWTYGEHLHISDIDCLVEVPPSKPEDVVAILPTPDPEDWEKGQVIGALIAEQIRDGDAIEIGTGTYSEAVMDFLGSKNDLAIDSEMMYPAMIDLIRAGNITGKRRNAFRGKHVTTNLFLYPGDPRNKPCLDYMDNNPTFELRDVSYICNVPRIAANDNQVAINTAVTVDLTGQAVISHIGRTVISGPGGGLEYNIGSHYSKGGRSFTCLPSTAVRGTVSRIVPYFEPGTVVLVPNVFLDYLITEYGMVNLDGKSDRQRAEALISVAHPDFRAELKKAARGLFWP